jgi:Uma2 family endonuclease
MGSAAPNLQNQGLPAEDPTFYPTHDDMGESALQRLIVELFRPLLARFLAQQGIRAFVGADQFIYWVQGAPNISLAPDVYVLPGVSPDIAPKSWKVWETGITPSFAIEIMSEQPSKDEVLSPLRYDALGAKELVVFDPNAEGDPARHRFAVYRRAADGKFVRVEVTNADRIKSMELGCFVRVVGAGDGQRLRIGIGPEGSVLVPTEAEEQRARAQQEQARAEMAEAEVARLRAELERLRR